ncbi:unnamed protein product, partial [Tilletia controversa]
RSFPPRIIGLSDEEGEVAFGAVLIPGLDSFHQRGRPVTWKYDPPEQDTTGRTKLMLDSSTSANSQVFNNYGAKSVEELFGSPPSGPAAAQSSTLPSTRHWWKYGAKEDPPAALLDDIRARLRSSADVEEDYSAMTELDWIEEDGEVFEALEVMLRARLQTFHEGPSLAPHSFEADSQESEQTVREQVARMTEVYRCGQEAILSQAIAWCGTKLDELEGRWAELGGDEE